MPINISDGGRVDLYNMPRGEAIRVLLVAVVELANEEMAAPAITEADKIRHKFIAAIIFHINQDADIFLPAAKEADKTDKIKRLFSL